MGILGNIEWQQKNTYKMAQAGVPCDSLRLSLGSLWEGGAGARKRKRCSAPHQPYGWVFRVIVFDCHSDHFGRGGATRREGPHTGVLAQSVWGIDREVAGAKRKGGGRR